MKILICISAVVLLGSCGDKPVPPEVPATPRTSTKHSVPAIPPVAKAEIFYIKDFSQKNARFVGLTIGEEMQSAELRIRAYFTPEEPIEGKSAFTYEKIIEGNGVVKIIATSSGLMDDSVETEQLIAIFKQQNETRSVLSNYGMRFKCQRGENPGKWTNKLCP